MKLFQFKVSTVGFIPDKTGLRSCVSKSPRLTGIGLNDRFPSWISCGSAWISFLPILYHEDKIITYRDYKFFPNEHRTFWLSWNNPLWDNNLILDSRPHNVIQEFIECTSTIFSTLSDDETILLIEVKFALKNRQMKFSCRVYALETTNNLVMYDWWSYVGDAYTFNDYISVRNK